MKHIDVADLQWVIFISLWSYGQSQIICPDVAELASTVTLTSIFSGPALVIYTKTEWAPGKSLTVTCPKNAMTCINNPYEDRINGTVVNKTHSFLEIQGTKRTDAGDWTCEVRDVATTNCSLVLRKLPTCNISSGKNTSNLLLHEALTLTVGITDYYCSVPADFILKTGDTTEELETNKSVADIESDVYNSTFNISDFHIGTLELLFSCNNISKSVACGGVNTLLKKPPSCNITSDKNTDELSVGEELSLLVYIEEYNCSRNTKYQLQTGEMTMGLTRSKTGVCNETVTFNVRESHFGPVRLRVTCNDISTEVQPGGINMLRQRRPTTIYSSSSTTTDCKCHCGSGLDTGCSPSFVEKYLIVIIAVPIGGIALIITIILICCYCVKPRYKSSKTSRGINDSCPYADVADNLNSRPVSIRPDAYAEISDINGTFTNQAFDKESARRHDDNHIILSGEYASGDDVQKEAPQSYSTSVLRPNDMYSKVNKRISNASVSGQC